MIILRYHFVGQEAHLKMVIYASLALTYHDLGRGAAVHFFAPCVKRSEFQTTHGGLLRG